MRFQFSFNIWSNNEQKHVGTSVGLIDIDESDLPRLKKVWKHWLNIKYPGCKNCGECAECNGGKPMLIWSLGQNEDKAYFQKKYIDNLSTLKLVDISIIFKDAEKYLATTHFE